MICLALPMPPSANALYANRKAAGRRGRITTREYLAWQQEAALVLSMQRPGNISGDVVVEYRFGPRIPNADLGNREKALSDLLVKCRVIQNDKRIVKMSLEWDDSIKGCSAIIREAATREAKRVAA